MVKKIYFAGAVRGGREEAQTYNELIEFLDTFGKVLNEYVGASWLTEKGESKGTDYIFGRNKDWLKEAEFVVADVTVPSLGVGYVICESLMQRKKILCLFKETSNRNLSAIIDGNPMLDVIKYSDIKEAKEIISSFINKEKF